MTISLDREAVAPAETERNLPSVPGDAHLAACALHLLLAQHLELVDLPIRWEIEGGTITPRLPHAADETPAMAGLLATALELTLHSSPFTATSGVPMRHIWCEGRWGGAEWQLAAYGLAEGGDRDE